MKLGELDLADAAVEAAGNWRKFDSFCWFRDNEIEDPLTWSIVYTHHRDSGLLDQSNAAVIHKALKPFTEADDPDIVFESHNHWAVGHIDGFSLRVFKDGQITDAFRTYHDLAAQMAEYPVLDDSDYSEREFEVTLANIMDAAWRVKHEFDLPDGWESDVYSWLSDNESAEVESRDDQGGYPSEESLQAAFEALGYESKRVEA